MLAIAAALTCGGGLAAEPPAAPSVDLRHGPLRVSDNGRFLVHADGTPYFYLGDTAWELFHRLNREEAERYLENRRRLRYTVVQAVALSELNGINTPNAHGDRPLLNRNPATPDITPGASPDDPAQYDYWDHVDFIVNTAQAKGIHIGFLPTWGSHVLDKTLNESNAQAYGEFLGRRYRGKPIVWILGGDRPPQGHEATWRALARGIAIGVSGTEDYSKVLMTYHPPGGGSSARWFHDEAWLDFNMQQNGHCANVNVGDRIASDYQRTPVKPVMDGEPLYEEHPICFNAKANGYSDAYEIRKFAYWDVFGGAHGHTYGNHSLWQMHSPARGGGVNGPISFWYEAMDRPGSTQMQHLRALIESRPFLSRVPDQALLVSETGGGAIHVRASRGDGYLFVYSAAGNPFTLHLGKISGNKVRAYWYDPRDGTHRPAGDHANTGTREFTPPTSGRGNDWVLVLDDIARGFAAPGPRGNAHPVVRLTAPNDKVPPRVPATIRLTATATDADGRVREVEILSGETSLGKSGRSPFHFDWNVSTPGFYTLTARATDDKGEVAVSTPITVAVGPIDTAFYRAINLNGPALTIDGHAWEGQSVPNYSFQGSSFESRQIPLDPPTDENRARMIRSSVWNGAGSNVTVRALPPGTYRVYLYVWEDSDPTTYDVFVQDKQVQAGFNSGRAGQWKKLGPWTTEVTNGTLQVRCSPGDANLSGIELWRVAPGQQ